MTSAPKKTAPSLLTLSFAWAFAIALLMTLISFLPGARDVFSDPASGEIRWLSVGYLFLSWLVAAELVMLIGAGLYLGRKRLKQKGPRRPD
ncbi:hypothetical protein F2Q65_06365 [Thiohalocapsa marina]|uniref:Uncharacterized protein n=1 Tax=Thiohalocapsa marina TaxID=424902 RepID=A0A5M8FMN3_9GAMM|nr:hypothetical protein [Thiohalocapsa marina]KAA6185989.1 hypothetical protein F2Q65_06365 [Thiohalocapsa marina]